MEKEALIKIGLSNREAEAYITLLQLEEALASEISERTRESRSNVYDTLKSLMNKGLVSYAIRNNKKYFRATSPNKLIDFLKEKEQDLQSILPNLLALHRPRKKKAVVEVYEGVEGMKTILLDIIRTGKDWLGTSTGGSVKIMPKHFMEKIHNMREKKKITLRCLCNKTKQAINRWKPYVGRPYFEIRYIPEKFQSPATMYVYGNKLVILMWLEKELPLAISIQSDGISKSFMKYFKWLWSIADKKA
ncbi:helix-turn-helix domain-containing protein [Candidatus Woesearchaeota archaeon]|nr:helix-turn-helix domain-containing protein [Candidatus Woesearchaeota archaeon]